MKKTIIFLSTIAAVTFIALIAMTPIMATKMINQVTDEIRIKREAKNDTNNNIEPNPIVDPNQVNDPNQIKDINGKYNTQPYFDIYFDDRGPMDFEDRVEQEMFRLFRDFITG
jgi:hypothetical protein